MVNDRKLLAGGVVLIALLAIIAGGCTGSMNNTPASNTSTPTTEASTGGVVSNTPAPISSPMGLPAQNPSVGDQALLEVNSPTPSPTVSPQPSASTMPVTVVSQVPLAATTGPVMGRSPMLVKTKLVTPKLVSPADGSDCQGLATITLKWQSVAGATGYYVEAQCSDDGTTWKQLKAANAGGTSYTDSSLTTPGFIRWRVTAMDSTQDHLASVPSGWWTYTTYAKVDKIIANP